jgi:uncharacterized protein (TIGR02147 family)
MDSIYTYTDYRKYLADFYREKKAANRHFSHRHIAAKIGLKSTGHFSLVIKGKANISSQLTSRFCELMKLRKKETEYFESLVHYNQAKTDSDRRKALERLLSNKECKVKIVEPDRFEYYGKWYYSAVLRLFDFYPFAGDYAGLGRLLDPAISPAEAKKAVSLLLRLGFIEQKPNGAFESAEHTLSTGYSAQSEHITAYLKQSVDMAKHAIDRFPRDERNISSVHFSVSEETYRKIEQETRNFRRKIMSIAEADARPTRAYQFSVQAFPISRRYPKRIPS